MYNAQNAQKTVTELRNVMSILRSAELVDSNFESLEAALGHGLVDLSLAVELIDQLARENEALRKQLGGQDVPPEELDN